MASNFPSSTDLNLFNNPIKDKVDDVHTVTAIHVNQLQDSVLAMQESLISSVTSNSWAASLLPNGTSAYDAINLIAVHSESVNTDLDAHIALADESGTVAHPSEVISFSPWGNLSATRVHWALQELQGDITNIMNGNNVEGTTLDDRYIMETEASQTITGDLAISGDFSVTQEISIGSGASDAHTINGVMTFMHGASVASADLEIQSSARILFQDGASIESTDQNSYLKFLSNEVLFGSNKGFTFNLDTDDVTDGIAEEASFAILNGTGGIAFEVKEDGSAALHNLSIAPSGGLSHDGNIESLTKVIIAGTTRYQESLISEQGPSSIISLDINGDDTDEFFAVTRHGNDASVDSHPDVLLKAKEDRLIAPNYMLRPSIQEKGVGGWEFHSTAAGNEFGGYMVNFKSEMTNIPVDIDLAMIESLNAQNIDVTDITKYGFFVRFEAIAAGISRIKFLYETIGN